MNFSLHVGLGVVVKSSFLHVGSGVVVSGRYDGRREFKFGAPILIGLFSWLCLVTTCTLCCFHPDKVTLGR